MTRQLALAASVLGFACDGQPARPTGPGDQPTGGEDVQAPVVRFIKPHADTTYRGVGYVDVSVKVTDQTAITSVLASVSGGVNFGFQNSVAMPVIELSTTFRVPVSGRSSNTVVFTINAQDTHGNSGRSTLRLVIE